MSVDRLVPLLLYLCVIQGCANLPDAEKLITRYPDQAVRFETAHGQLSPRKTAHVINKLRGESGDIRILDRQIVLEQAMIGNPLVLGNKVTLLLDGPATYAAMFTAIGQARDHINLESYIIDDDEIGRQFGDLLLAAQARGVQVNLIYDSIGAINTPRAFFEGLQNGGIEVLEFNPVNPLNAKKEWLLNNRDHRKLLVVDGRIAFVGGINISSVYSSGSILHRGNKGSSPETFGAAANSLGWRDTDLQIEGPVVGEFQKLFIESWEKQRGEPLAARDYFPALSTQGRDIVRAIGSTPDDPYSLIYLTLISAIGNAQRQVQLTNAYFVPDPQMLESLIEAAQRGVAVTLILPSQSDSSLVFHAGRSNYTSLLRAGIRIYERRGALLHAKTASIDGVWSCVGSSNLDWRSFLDNDEINAEILGGDFASKMETMFNNDLAESQAIELRTWEQRSLLLKFKEWTSSLLQRLL